jgi:hypothetical protein
MKIKNNKIDIGEVNKIPPYTLDAITIDLSNRKLTIKEFLEFIKNTEW